MKKGLKSFSSLFVFALLTIISCKFEIGMGQSVDLEAPVVTITSPQPYGMVGLNFTMEGTCTDNIGVVSVVVSNNDTGFVYGNAVINGNEWTYDVQLPPECDSKEISLLVTANDKAKNVSTKSYKPITLRVDETAPNALDWYVDRGNGIQVPLYALNILKTTNIYLSENKDIPQNDKFEVHGHFYDAMSINEVALILKDEDGKEIIRKNYSSDSNSENYIGVNNSIFSPVFEFSHSELVAKDETLKTGIHYLQVGYVVKDDHGNISSNNLKWILWYPESDYPQIYQNQMDTENNILNITIDTDFPLDIFDDDGLSEVYYALKNDTVYSEITGNDLDEKCQNLIDNTNGIRDTVLTLDKENFEKGGSDSSVGGKRDNPVSLKTPTTPRVMYLIVCVKDINERWNCKIVTANITDASSPMLFVESPKNNEKPEMNLGKNTFTIKGYVLGKNASAALEMVYIPGSASATEKKTLSMSIFENPETLDLSRGQIKRDLRLSNAVDHVDDNGNKDGLKKQTFETEYDILTELSKYDSEAETNYFFMFKLISSTGEKIYQIYQLNKDIANPTIEIISPTNMKAVDYEKDNLEIRYKAFKESGLQIVEQKVTINGTVYTPASGLTKDGDYYKVIIPKSALETMSETSPQQTIEFYAKDSLGKETTEERTIVLTTLPVLNEITTEHPNGTYIKGDVLKFQAKFSDAVKVLDLTATNKPRLDIRYSASDSTPKYAEFDSGSGTNTLVFTFTVPENAVSDGIIIKTKSDTDKTAIDVNNTTIKPVAAGEGDAYITTTNLLSGKKLKLDGVCPEIEAFTISSVGGITPVNETKTYLKADGKLIIEMTMSEPVQINGNPVAVMKVGSNNLNFNFSSINDKTLTFEHIITSSSSNGTVKNTKASCFDSTNKEYIKDINGNELKLPTDTDVDTEYVIDTQSPAQLTVTLTGELVDGTFTVEPTLSISSGIETGCLVEYSLNNGVVWNTYDANNKPVIPDGSYTIIARQTDKAGNVSVLSTPESIRVKASFPAISTLAVKTPNGKYKAGSDIEFTLAFSEALKVPDDSVSLTFEAISGEGTKEGLTAVTIPVDASPITEQNILTFKYTVQDGDDFQGIKITALTFTDALIDAQSHKVPSSVRTAYASGTLDPISRPSVILDAKAPQIITAIPANNGTSTLANTAGIFKLEFTFDEPVYKENGIITIQRKGQWGIPAVIDGTEFKLIYDRLNETDQDYLIYTTEKGNISTDVRDAWTGISVGPYKKITHGIYTTGTNAGAPDTSTKFVLDFNLGLFDGEVTLNEHEAINSGYNIPASTGKTFYVKNIRKALEDYGYHKYEIDVSNNSLVSLSSDRKILTIKMDNEMPAGIEWEVIIPNTAFRDASGNMFEGFAASIWKTDSDRKLGSGAGAEDSDLITDSDYTFTTKGAAQPFVRVDRYSHGFGATIPNENGSVTTIKDVSKKYGVDYRYNVTDGRIDANYQSNLKMNTEPTGFARVRIDSQTKNAKVDYGVMLKSSKSATAEINGTDVIEYTTAPDVFLSKRGSNNNATASDLAGITLSNTNKDNGVIFVVGAGKDGTDLTNLYTARKDYVRAVAKVDDDNISTSGYEGVFKSVVYITSGCISTENINNKDYVKYNLMNVEGGTFKGGQPSVDGFPLKDGHTAEDFWPYTKNMYRIGSDKTTTAHDYFFVTYEFVTSDVALLLGGSNYSENYPYVSYGDMVNITRCRYYGGKSGN